MAKRLTEKQKKELTSSFIDGQSINSLADIYKCTSNTISRNLKKILGEKGVNWFAKDNAIENYGFKLESSYKIDSDLKEIFIKDE